MAPQTTEAANRKVDEKAKTVKRKPVPASANTPGRSTPNQNRDQLGNQVEKFCQWALNVAVLAAAIVFGIWAPLSYNITLNGNSSNDASSSSMLSAVLAASSQAFAAASTQRAILDDMSGRIGAVGQLWLLDFCAAQTAISACKDFISEINVPSLVTYLASTTLTHFATATPSYTATISYTATPGTPATPSYTSTSSKAPSAAPTATVTGTPMSGLGLGVSVHLSVPAILGIVFAVLVVVGWLIGVYLFLSRRRRTVEEVET